MADAGSSAAAVKPRSTTSSTTSRLQIQRYEHYRYEQRHAAAGGQQAGACEGAIPKHAKRHYWAIRLRLVPQKTDESDAGKAEQVQT